MRQQCSAKAHVLAKFTIVLDSMNVKCRNFKVSAEEVMGFVMCGRDLAHSQFMWQPTNKERLLK